MFKMLKMLLEMAIKRTLISNFKTLLFNTLTENGSGFEIILQINYLWL